MPRSQSSKSKSSLSVPNSSIAPYTPHPLPSFGQTMKEGFAFGTGSAIAHRMFGTAANMIVPSVTTSEIPCNNERLAFETCMKTKSADDFCGNEQTAYSHCIQLKKKE